METPTSTTPPVTPSPHPPRRVSRGGLAGVIAAVAAVGVAAGVLIAGDDDRVGAVDTAAQVASVRVGCESWLESDTIERGTEDWCGGMAEWMMQRLDRDGIGSEMMWGNPRRMSDACQQWMAGDPPDGADVDAESWCGSMAGWMADHIGEWTGRADWDEWMMHGMSRRGR